MRVRRHGASGRQPRRPRREYSEEKNGFDLLPDYRVQSGDLAELPGALMVRGSIIERLAVSCVLWVSVVLVALPAGAQALRVVDLGVVATLSPPGPLAPGAVAQIELTITNQGPDVAALVSVISGAYPFLDFELFTLVPSEPSPCQMFYDDFIAPPGSGQPSFLVAQVVVGSLAPGESRACTIRLDVSLAAAGEFDLEFVVLNGEAGTDDTNPANNEANLALVFASIPTSPVTIPVTGVRASIVLLLALFAIGFVRLSSR